MTTVEISTDFEKFKEGLRNAEKLIQPLLTIAMGKALTAVKGEDAPYPPQPDRDRAKSFNTYVRGVGSYPKSAFVEAPKEPGGYKIRTGVKRGQIKFTSQQMGSRFTEKVTQKENAVVGNLHNSATYSGYVIGSDDEQVKFHAETGWVSTDDAIDRAMPTIEKVVDDAITTFIGML